MSRARKKLPRVGIVGLGYMGLASGLAFAAHGLPVLGYDSDSNVRANISSGKIRSFEVGLERLLKAQLRSMRFETVETVHELVERSEGIFLCVPSPSLSSGRIDLRPLRKCVEQVAEAAGSTSGFKVIVVKSTVVPGTTSAFVARLLQLRGAERSRDIGLACNPEFLAEGTMVHDSLHPHRVVLGVTDPRSLAWLRRAYAPFHAPLFVMRPTAAELVKYSSNAFLALKISFANEISRLSNGLGIDVDDVMKAVGSDPRIGERFLKAGPGFGGSCFEKDVRALVHLSKSLGFRFRAGETALRINREQLAYVVGQIESALGSIRHKRLALLGLAFKAGTDDVRGSRAVLLADALASSGAKISGHDPAASENFMRTWQAVSPPSRGALEVCSSVERALDGVDAAIIQADWPIYRNWPRSWTRLMKRPIVFDLRRALSPSDVARAGLIRIALGVGSTTADS